MDEYTTTFYQLLAQVELMETELQMTLRYTSSLREELREVVVMFDPSTVAAVHQCALQVEKQQRIGIFGSIRHMPKTQQT